MSLKRCIWSILKRCMRRPVRSPQRWNSQAVCRFMKKTLRKTGWCKEIIIIIIFWSCREVLRSPILNICGLEPRCRTCIIFWDKQWKNIVGNRNWGLGSSGRMKDNAGWSRENGSIWGFSLPILRSSGRLPAVIAGRIRHGCLKKVWRSWNLRWIRKKKRRIFWKLFSGYTCNLKKVE